MALDAYQQTWWQAQNDYAAGKISLSQKQLIQAAAHTQEINKQISAGNSINNYNAATGSWSGPTVDLSINQGSASAAATGGTSTYNGGGGWVDPIPGKIAAAGGAAAVAENAANAVSAAQVSTVDGTANAFVGVGILVLVLAFLFR